MDKLNPFSKNIEKDEVNAKLQGTGAFQQLKMLQGYEGMWIKARRNNCCYVMNKIISITIAFTLAAVTLSFKKTTYILYN